MNSIKLAMQIFYLLLFSLSVTASYAEQLPIFKDGKDYFSYKQPIAEEPTADNKIKIKFFFSYECRICLMAADNLSLYKRMNPDKVDIEWIPAATPGGHFSAAVYYALEGIGRPDLADLFIFDTAEQKFNRNSRNRGKFLQEWLTRKQINIETFLDVFNSELVAAKVNQSINSTLKYGVFTLPFVSVSGRYVLTGSTLYNDDYTMAVLDSLTAKIVQEQRGKK